MIKHKCELYDFSCQLKVETEKAWLVFDGEEDFWLPKSQCEMEKQFDGSYVAIVPQWLAEEKGII